MKKFFITSATLCLGWLSAGAQQMSAEQATVDCGQVIFAHPVTVEYKLRNDATKPLVITKVYTSCGCATVSYPKSVIAAGDSFTLSATYDAQQMGHFEKLVGVYGTNGENPLMLTMKGVVVSEKQDFSGQYPYKIGDFLCDVADLEFDDVNVGDKPMAKIHIMNNTDETLSWHRDMQEWQRSHSTLAGSAILDSHKQPFILARMWPTKWLRKKKSLFQQCSCPISR